MKIAITYDPATHSVVPKTLIEWAQQNIDCTEDEKERVRVSAALGAFLAPAPVVGQQDGCTHPFRTATAIEAARGGGVCSTCGVDLATKEKAS